jgi:hypothetical protein
MENSTEEKAFAPIIFSEDVLSYFLHQNYCSKESKVFFKLFQNISIKKNRNWHYWCAPDIDALEVTRDDVIISYELKSVRRRKGEPEYPALYDGIGQALAYLNLPWIYQNDQIKYSGGVSDFVYLVYARKKLEFPDHEKKIFNLLPMGVLIALPDGKIEKVKEAPKNPLQNVEAKCHFLNNLNTLQKYSIDSTIYGKIKGQGETFSSSNQIHG